MSFFDSILSVIFPDTCVGCSARGSLLCGACRKKLPPASSPREDFITSIYAYADPRMRRLIKLLKYKNTRHAAELFGTELASALVEYIGEESLFVGGKAILVVPVPLSKKRMKTRGYNQAELLAKAMLRKCVENGMSISLDTKLIEKHIETSSQADLSKRSERLKNLGDCFRVVRGRVPNGELVILIDDVTTTGATLLACKKTLQAAGFRNVHALTVAH